jgi:AmmeMemoRadiSam system protein A
MPPHSSCPLSDSDRRELLARARQAIHESVVSQRIADFPPATGPLAEPCGAFVTLYRRKRLRGCIGQTAAEFPLAETVVQCAIGAAHSDPRFAPVTAHELGDLTIEISVLSEPQQMPWQSVEIGKHGLLVVRGELRGLLLPKVASERNWSAERFMQETCRKAGFAPGSGQDYETQFLGFTVECFSDADFPATQTAANCSPSDYSTST